MKYDKLKDWLSYKLEEAKLSIDRDGIVETGRTYWNGKYNAYNHIIHKVKELEKEEQQEINEQKTIKFHGIAPFEYIVKGSFDVEQLEQIININTYVGWELHGTVLDTKNADNKFFCIFKRPKLD